jgi:hypothetical protein
VSAVFSITLHNNVGGGQCTFDESCVSQAQSTSLMSLQACSFLASSGSVSDMPVVQDNACIGQTSLV